MAYAHPSRSHDIGPARRARLLAVDAAGADGLEPGPDHPLALLRALKTLGFLGERDGRFTLTQAGARALAAQTAEGPTP